MRPGRARLLLAIALTAIAPFSHRAFAAEPPAAPAIVGANLNISPKRLVFDAQTHSATVFVFNDGDAAGSYSVELRDEVMLDDGRIVGANDPEASGVAGNLTSARSFMVVTPRRITLGPHENQTIRIRALAPPDAAAGEYRTHLVVSALPPQDVGLTAEQAAGKADDKTLQVRVIALYSLAIPLIVRQGAPDVRGHLDNLVLEAGADRSAIEMDLARDGKSSLYGDIEIRSGGPKGPVVGAITGVGVYPEIARRRLKLALSRRVASGERLLVTWTDQDVKPGTLIASKDLTAP